MPLLLIFDGLFGIFGFSYLIFQLYIGFGAFRNKPAKKEKGKYQPKEKCCIVLCSKNEEKVIGNLINDIKKQTYPNKLIDIWLVDDNSDDKTIQIAKDNKINYLIKPKDIKPGKVHSLKYFLETINEQIQSDYYDLFLFFDADNRIHPNYISDFVEQSQNYKAATSLRNSTNPGQSWISETSCFWFLYENLLYNKGKHNKGLSAGISGTGYLIKNEIFKKYTPEQLWPHDCITEDQEITINLVLKGEKIAYIESSEFFDEQPTTFSQNWRQKTRWVQGINQNFFYYIIPIFKKMIIERDRNSLELFFKGFPSVLLIFFRILIGYLMVFVGWESFVNQNKNTVFLITSYLMGIVVLEIFLTVILSYNKRCVGLNKSKIIKGILLFPIFCLCFFPISIYAIFAPRKWKTIYHGEDNPIKQPRK